jgi:hypothetical protein
LFKIVLDIEKSCKSIFLYDLCSAINLFNLKMAEETKDKKTKRQKDKKTKRQKDKKTKRQKDKKTKRQEYNKTKKTKKTKKTRIQEDKKRQKNGHQSGHGNPSDEIIDKPSEQQYFQ